MHAFPMPSSRKQSHYFAFSIEKLPLSSSATDTERVFWNYRYYRSNEFFSSDGFFVKYNRKKRKKGKRRERNFQLSRFGLRSELEYTNVASIVGNRVSSRKRFSNVYSPNAAWIRLTMRKTRPRVRCHFVITLTKHPHVNVAKYRGNGKRVSFHVE